MAECDIEDIMCQIKALTHLKGLQGALGEEKFKSEFPEFENLGEKLTDSILKHETNLKETLAKCGMPGPEEITMEPPGSVLVEEE